MSGQCDCLVDMCIILGLSVNKESWLASESPFPSLFCGHSDSSGCFVMVIFVCSSFAVMGTLSCCVVSIF
jgi:hypothetical protein